MPVEASQAGTRTRIGVLFGGTSGEREVSLDTARGVLEALRADDGPDAPEVLAIEWGLDGRFELDGRNFELGPALARMADLDCVFLALHGGVGEDGTLQGAMDLAGVRYTGSGVAASALAMDKPRAKVIAAAVGAAGAPAEVLRRDDFERDPDAAFDRLAPIAAEGAFLKPRAGGSSVAMARVGGPGELAAALRALLEECDEVLVEAAVDGLEVTCAVLERRGEPVALPLVEILPDEGRFFDFQQKYSNEGAFERCPAELLSAASAAEVTRRALAVHRAFGCRGLTRTDFIVRRPDGGADCDPVFLELNTLPGLTPRSLAPLAARAAGIEYRDLCLALVREAVARRADG